jgi:hypothetical protein
MPCSLTCQPRPARNGSGAGDAWHTVGLRQRISLLQLPHVGRGAARERLAYAWPSGVLVSLSSRIAISVLFAVVAAGGGLLASF